MLTVGRLQLIRSPTVYGPLESSAHLGAGLEACRSLTELSLRDNRIDCTAPLAALTALRSLDLTGNMIAAVEGLKACSGEPV